MEHIRPTYTEISESKSSSWSTAPNGSARCHDHWTIVTIRQDWPIYTDPRTGKPGTYSGRSYRVTERWISSRPEYRGQLVDSSSDPWKD